MALYRIYLSEINHGVAEIEADSADEARDRLFDDFDYITWTDSEIVDMDIETVEEV